ncbi:MAG: hypothetical protein PHE71_03320 [Candidatus Shapirobacteria bacterium]|nr:hypothetical protein [Candidatus Shapirobacteria bacterium]
MSWVAIFPFIGTVMVIVGSIFWILEVTLGTTKFKVGKALKYWFLGGGLTSFVLPVLIVGCILLANSFTAGTTVETTAATTVETTAATTVETTAATTVETTAATTTGTTITPIETVPISIGLDQPSKSWFLAKAGTLISGDVAIFDNDNNSKKTPAYDSKESTADVIYLTSDTYIWTEWGCYTIENATANDVATLINDKLTNGNFKAVRFFNGYTKLGTNTPTIINSKIDASAIILPAIETK